MHFDVRLYLLTHLPRTREMILRRMLPVETKSGLK